MSSRNNCVTKAFWDFASAGQLLISEEDARKKVSEAFKQKEIEVDRDAFKEAVTTLRQKECQALYDVVKDTQEAIEIERDYRRGRDLELAEYTKRKALEYREKMARENGAN